MVGLRAHRHRERLSAGRWGLEPYAGGEVARFLPLSVLGSREGLDRADWGRRRKHAPKHRLGAVPCLRLGAGQDPHASRSVTEVPLHAPLDKGWYREGQFGLRVHRANLSPWVIGSAAARSEELPSRTTSTKGAVAGKMRESGLVSTNVIDPIHSLAFSLQAKPGVYAVLVGSGLSRSAGIPTGWEVTLDLIRKLARLHNDEADPDPDAWYMNTFGKEPDYSELLDELAKTAAERQLLLQRYFEPTQVDREEGGEGLTPAHHALAALAAHGFIKVIVTTNFDRLMESALSVAGVEATILSTEDQVRGALPLFHTRCCVLKVHGDYRDPRIKNTRAELSEYPEVVEEFLRRVFDEFGLLVCGWSGDWDDALRRVLEGVTSRRFTTYWATRHRPSDMAQRLISHRQAEVIEIGDADTFFTQLKEYVTSIEEFSVPHPRSAELAVSNLKRYLSEPRHRIRLSDLVDHAVQEVVEAASGESFSPVEPKPTADSVAKRLRAYDAACSTLTAMAVVGGAWAEEEHYPVWERALERLSRTSSVPGQRNYTLWRDLQRYPATLLLYGLGFGAVEAQRLKFLNCLLTLTVQREHEDDSPVVGMLPPYFLLEMGEGGLQGLEGVKQRVTILNQWIHGSMRSQMTQPYGDDLHFDQVFDKLEVLVALRALSLGEAPAVGCFFWRGATRDRFLAEVQQSLQNERASSPFFVSGLLGSDAEKSVWHIFALEKEIEKKGWDVSFKVERIRRDVAQS